MAGGYLTVTNTGAEPDTLTGGTIDQAGSVEIHSMSMEGGVMKMAPVEGGLVVKPGETVTLKPGGYHLMFQGLKDPLKKGQRSRDTHLHQGRRGAGGLHGRGPRRAKAPVAAALRPTTGRVTVTEARPGQDLLFASTALPRYATHDVVAAAQYNLRNT